jgi:hypothetical protein
LAAHPSVPEPEPPPRTDLLVFGAVGLLLICGALWWVLRTPPGPGKQASPGGPRSVTAFVGARTCRECHPAEYAAHARSGHSQTLRAATDAPAARWLGGKSFPDPEQPGVTWSYDIKGRQLTALRRTDERTERFLLDYAFGSGHRAVTFVSTTRAKSGGWEGREHRLSYFQHLESMGLSPGQQQGPDRVPGTTAVGRDLSPRRVVRCFNCHSTITSARPGQDLDPATLIPNVSCERCHGPGQSHVEAARHGRTGLAMPFGPEGWTAGTLLRMCGECHRVPEVSPPGAIRPDNDVLARFQPVGLAQSRCYLRSEGRLSCVTCHSPHDRPSTDRLGYEALCLNCHQAAPQPACPVSPRAGCIDCHMPRREAIRGALFADHWIRIPERPPGRRSPGGAN